MAVESSVAYSSSIEDDPLDEIDELPADDLDGELDDDGEVSDEERAKAMGWKPWPVDAGNPQRHEYRGRPELWTDAGAFLAKAQDELPVLRERNRQLTEQVARLTRSETRLNTTITEQQGAIDRAVEIAQRADDRGYKRAMDELRQRQRQAVADGDTAAFDDIQAQIDAAATERVVDTAPAPRAPVAPATPPSNGTWPETTAFLSDPENAWFHTDKVLRAAMIAEHQDVLTERPTLGRAAQYELARERVVETFPDRFQDPEPPMPRTPAPAPAPAPRARVAARPAVMTPSAPQPRVPRNGADPFDEFPAHERADAAKGYERAKRLDPLITKREFVELAFQRLSPIDLHANRKNKAR